MLYVTSAAKEKLKNGLQAERKYEDSLVRLAPVSDDLERLEFTMDTEKEGDQVIKDNEGEKLLLIGEDILTNLSRFVLDYRDIGQEKRFIITYF